MLSVVTALKNLQPSQWKILSAIPKRFSSSTGYSSEEIEEFRKVFRTMSSYEESVSTKEYAQFLQKINFIKPMETYQHYADFGDRRFGGRFEINQVMKYISIAHDSRLLIAEYLKNFDLNNDGFVSKDDFEFLVKTLKSNDPKLKDLSYEDFLIKADRNNDGKVSVSECQEWLNENSVP